MKTTNVYLRARAAFERRFGPVEGVDFVTRDADRLIRVIDPSSRASIDFDTSGPRLRTVTWKAPQPAAS